jgi:hypothetical protein
MGFAAGGNTPTPDASVARLLAFYAAHDTGQLASGALLSLGALLFLAFASIVFRTLLTAAGEPSATAILCIGGG